jgi:hypothetical protein
VNEISDKPPPRPLSNAAKRALAEGEARRRAAEEAARAPRELGGRGGLDPARYGDWEVKGIACDF